MIKAVVFDIGGVIIDLNYNRAIESFKTKAGFTKIGDYLDPWRQKGFFELLETGKLSEDVFVEKCLAECRPGTTPEILEVCLNDFLDGIVPEKVEIIKKLHAKYPLFLLSNNNPISMRCCAKLFEQAGIPMDEYFQDKFISSDMKLAKPDAPIFLAAIKAIGCDPSEILFIDDSQKNIDGAAAVGITARLTNSLETFRKVLLPLC